MRRNKVIGMILLLCIFVTVSPTHAFCMEKSVYYVNNEKDLLSLAQSCSLDTYSQGLQVILNADIEIRDESFRGIPTFGGEFNGGNHTISGVNMVHEGSTVGLFRYIQPTGVVQNLKVEVNLQLTGTENCIGGIAGENRGIIENCQVYGKLVGKDYIGGIAAKNEATGQILACSFSGMLTGENFSGGIAGENYGLIKNCTNKGAVNTTVTPATLQLEELSITEFNAAEPIVSSMNTGGITGFNRGVMEGCVNQGIVGYPHVGYNVGGIAGRQDGYISTSANYGSVFGRKDVGGIVGQMEPYQVIKSDDDFFRELEEELDTLKANMDKAYDDIDESNEAVSSQFETVNRSVANLADRMEILSDRTVDFADENIETINDTMDRIHNVLVDFESATAELEAGSVDVSTGLEAMNVGLICMAMAGDSVEKGISQIDDGLTDISVAVNEIQEGAKQMQEGFDHLDAALANNESLDQAVEEIQTGMEAMNDGMKALTDALSKMADILSAAEDPLNADLDEIIDQTKDDLEAAKTNFDLAADEMDKALVNLQEEYEKDSEEISLAMTYFKQAASYFQTSLDWLNRGIQDFQDAAVEFENAAKMMGHGLDNFSQATRAFKSASDHFTLAINQMRETLDRETAIGAPEFSLLGDSVDAAKNDLFTSGDKLIAEMSKLNEVASDTADELTDDFRAINDQVFVVVDLIKEGYRNSMDEDKDIYLDISDEELLTVEVDQFEKMEATFGYVVNCENRGDVNGDINVGGVTGTLAIDYDFDPEGDLTSTESHVINFQFQTKGVLAQCENTGLVTAKKDYAGGIVGRMDLGSLFGCLNHSEVVSDDGNYVGGIAGGSSSVIRNSYSLSRLSGKDYIGGIVGLGSEIIGCTSMTTIDESVEFVGMVAGDVQDGMFAEDDDEEEVRIANNVFVSEKWAGIDSISYAGKAEPVSYEVLSADENLPEVFRHLHISFVADEKLVASYPFVYQKGLEAEELPEIPKREGYLGQWPEYDFDQLTFPDTLVASYIPLEKVLAFTEDGELADLLAEGVFSPDASLEMTTDQAISQDLLTDMNKISQLHVAIKDNEIANEGYTFRYRVPEQKEVELYAWVGNGWQSLDTVWDGSYLVFQWPKEEFVFIVYEKTTDIRIYIGVAMLAIAMLLLVAVKKRKKKRAKKAEDRA